MRARGHEATLRLTLAAEAYRAALVVFTRADFPQDWARTQNNLGLTLAARGEQASSEEAVLFFANAATAFRSALEVFTRDQTPEAWAETQFWLGGSLMKGGERSEGAERVVLLKNASECFERALELFPDNPAAMQGAEFVYHERLFEFARAFEISERRLSRDDSVGARLDVMETSLTTARFGQCLQQGTQFKEGSLDARFTIVRDALRLACAYGAKQNELAYGTAVVLSQESATLHERAWTATGTKRFLSLDAGFTSNRESWIKLFETIETGDGPALGMVASELAETLKR